MCFPSVLGRLDPTPDCGILEFAGIVVFSSLKLILWLAPSETVVPIACESSIGDGNHEACCHHKAQMGDAVIHEESLCELWERSGDGIGPKDSSTVDSAEHHEVTESPCADDISGSRCVHNDGVGRALVDAVHGLGTAGSDQRAQRVEGRE